METVRDGDRQRPALRYDIRLGLADRERRIITRHISRRLDI